MERKEKLLSGAYINVFGEYQEFAFGQNEKNERNA
jgi:hypothetical protein